MKQHPATLLKPTAKNKQSACFWFSDMPSRIPSGVLKTFCIFIMVSCAPQTQTSGSTGTLDPDLSSLITEKNAHVWLDPANEFKDSLSYDTTNRRGGLLLSYLADIDPYKTLPSSLLLSKSHSLALNAVPPTGLLDSSDKINPFRFGIIKDENQKRVIRMRFVQGQPPVSLEASDGIHQTHRYLITLDSKVGGADIKHIPFNQDTWVALAYKAPSPAYQGSVEAGTNTLCTGSNILDLGGISTSRAGDSSIYMGLKPGNLLTFGVNYNQNYDTNASRATLTWVLKPQDNGIQLKSGEWFYVVMKLRLSNRLQDQPDTTIWVAPNNTAPLNLVQHIAERNAWEPLEQKQLYPYAIARVGPYFYCNSAGGSPPPDLWTQYGNPVFQLDFAGMYVLPVKLVPKTTAQDFLSFLKSKTEK